MDQETHEIAVLTVLLALGEVASLPAIAKEAGLSRVNTLQVLKKSKRTSQMPQTRDWVLSDLG